MRKGLSRVEKLLRALERRFGRIAPQNVAVLFIAPKAAFYIWLLLEGRRSSGGVPAVLEKLYLVPQLVLEGEIWRLFTFLFVSPRMHMSPIFFIFYLLILFMFCSGLQARWGPLRLIVFLLFGWILTVAASFFALAFDPYFILGVGLLAVETTILFAFATYYPDFIIRLFFVLPVKVKWIALVTAGYGAILFTEGPWDVLAAYAPRVVILGACANYLLFCGPGLWKSLRHRQAATSRRRQFEDAMRRGHEERDRLTAEDREREREDR